MRIYTADFIQYWYTTKRTKNFKLVGKRKFTNGWVCTYYIAL